eukprot:gene41959-52009_t
MGGGFAVTIPSMLPKQSNPPSLPPSHAPSQQQSRHPADGDAFCAPILFPFDQSFAVALSDAFLCTHHSSFFPSHGDSVEC